MTNTSFFLAVSLCAGLALSASISAADNVIQVANWNDYIDEKVIEDFTAETGIKVEYQTFENDEQGIALIRQPGMDVVAPPTVHLKSIVSAGLLQPFAGAQIKGWSDTHSFIMQRVRLHDASASHVVPYMWGRIGIVVDSAKVKQALGRDAEPSWDLVFNKDNLENLSSCGVSILDSPNDILSLYSLYRGRLIDQISERKIDKFKEEMSELAPLYASIDSAGYLDQLPQGGLCVAMVWEGDGRSLEASHENLALLMPAEGTALFMDTMAIPAAADNPDGARQYVEFMSRPENSVRNAEYTGYNSPSVTAMAAMAEGNPGRAIDMSEVPVFLPQPPIESLYRNVTDYWSELVQALIKPAATPDAQASARAASSREI